MFAEVEADESCFGGKDKGKEAVVCRWQSLCLWALLKKEDKAYISIIPNSKTKI
ncbi:uncharacterized protein METZ01_LOCUS456273, partial [marine metagenome]